MAAKRRHAAGYEEYRRSTGHRRHRVPSTWSDKRGEYCAECAYPVARPAKPKKGDCYEAAARVILEALDTPDLDDLVVCHGIVTGDSGNVVGVRYGHAWVERDVELPLPDGGNATVRFVIDRSNGKAREMPAALYYHLGSIDRDEVRRYPAKEAMERMYRTRQYGPWEPGLSPELGK